MRELIRHIIREHIMEQNPKGFWTDDELKKTISQFNSLSDFREKFPSAYATTIKRGLHHLLDDLERKKFGGEKFWTKDKVIETAKQFEKLKDFENAFPKAVSNARKEGYIDELKDFLEHGKRKYWTLEKVLELASKYETIKDFRVNHKDAYQSAARYGWLDELRKVLKSSRGEEWTLDKVKERASKYNTLQDFYKNDYKAYYAAIRHKWVEEISSNLERLGNLYKRAVYALEFPDKSVYVGLTLNLNNRERQHIGHERETPVSLHIKNTGLKPIFKVISNDYIDAEDARNLEDCTIGQYKSEGWNMLNTAKAGALGACQRIYSLEKIKEVASKFSSIGEFKKNAQPFYRAALRNGWFDEVTASMGRKVGKRITKDQVRDVAQKYTTLSDFEREQPSYYAAAKRNQWNDITSHLQRKQKKRGDIIFIQDQQKP